MRSPCDVRTIKVDVYVPASFDPDKTDRVDERGRLICVLFLKYGELKPPYSPFRPWFLQVRLLSRRCRCLFQHFNKIFQLLRSLVPFTLD